MWNQAHYVNDIWIIIIINTHHTKSSVPLSYWPKWFNRHMQTESLGGGWPEQSCQPGLGYFLTTVKSPPRLVREFGETDSEKKDSLSASPSSSFAGYGEAPWHRYLLTISPSFYLLLPVLAFSHHSNLICPSMATFRAIGGPVWPPFDPLLIATESYNDLIDWLLFVGMFLVAVPLDFWICVWILSEECGIA